MTRRSRLRPRARRWPGCAWFLALAALAIGAGGAAAQDAGRAAAYDEPLEAAKDGGRWRTAAGVNWRGGFFERGAGGHGLLEGSLPVGDRFALVAAGLVLRSAGQTAVGLSAGARIEGRSEPRFFAGAGPALTRADVQEGLPFSRYLGVYVNAGLELVDRAGRTWFVDLRPQFFGNIAYDRDITRSFWMVSVGVEW